MDFLELAKARYSCRCFTEQQVEDEKIERLIEAARIAPTAKNIQPQKIYILRSEDALAKINELCPCIYGASTVFLFAYDEDKQWRNDLDDKAFSGQQDCAIVATHVMLEAQQLGLASCWVCHFPNSKTEMAFNLPENERAVLLMPVGYADEEKGGPGPNHKKFRDDVEMVRVL